MLQTNIAECNSSLCRSVTISRPQQYTLPAKREKQKRNLQILTPSADVQKSHSTSSQQRLTALQSKLCVYLNYIKQSGRLGPVFIATAQRRHGKVPKMRKWILKRFALPVCCAGLTSKGKKSKSDTATSAQQQHHPRKLQPHVPIQSQWSRMVRFAKLEFGKNTTVLGPWTRRTCLVCSRHTSALNLPTALHFPPFCAAAQRKDAFVTRRKHSLPNCCTRSHCQEESSAANPGDRMHPKTPYLQKSHSSDYQRPRTRPDTVHCPPSSDCAGSRLRDTMAPREG